MLGIDFVDPTLEVMVGSVEYSWRYGLSIYDASYLAVSEELEAQLVIADQKMISSAQETERIVAIADYY